jgi:prophage DNA circulation protein
MKRIVAFTLTALVLAIPATQASAAKQAGPTTAQFRAMQKQVTALQKQVKTLQKQQKELDSFTSALVGVLVCENAVITDALQGTWNIVDQIAQATQGGKTYFGAQTALADKGACAAFKITRSQGIPPTALVFNSLVALLT